MSHFVVAVITKGQPSYEDIENALAPYQENNMGDCPRQYLEFHSLSKEYKEKYETGTIKKMNLGDGTFVDISWNPYLNKQVSKEECEEIKANDSNGIATEIVEIPLKEIYSTFEEYLEKYLGVKKDEEMQDYGYWENPNAKWDWFHIGGRWAGMLKIPVECKNYGIGKESWLWKGEDVYKTTAEYKTVDSARIKDLVFPDTTFIPYAVIGKGGEWIAQGHMGWWGISTSTENQLDDFIKNYKKNVLDNADDDDYITIVDCHI